MHFMKVMKIATVSFFLPQHCALVDAVVSLDVDWLQSDLIDAYQRQNDRKQAFLRRQIIKSQTYSDWCEMEIRPANENDFASPEFVA